MPNLRPATFVPDDLFDGTVPHNGFFLGLLGGDPSGPPSLQLADLVEPDYPDYSRVGPLVFYPDPENAAENHYWYGEPAAFKLPVDVDGFPIWGWFLVCSFDDGDLLLSCQVYKEPEIWGYAGDNTEIYPTVVNELVASANVS